MYSKSSIMNITEFNEMREDMVNLLRWVHKYHVADTSHYTIPLQFHRMSDNNWLANPYTPEKIVDDYLTKVWVMKKDEK